MLYVVFLVAICSVNLLLGALILTRNPKAQSGRAFFAISFFVCAWAVANYLAGLPSLSVAVNNVSNSLAYLFAFLAVLSSIWFSANFPVVRRIEKRWLYALIILSTAMVFLSFSTMATGKAILHNHQVAFSSGPLLPLYLLGMLLLFISTLKRLFGAFLHNKGQEKQQMFYILLGFILTWLPAIVTNAVLPAITSTWATTKLGPLFTIFLISGIAYAIAKHRLFDIRLTIARSLGYLLSIVVLSSIYGFIVFGVAKFIFHVHISILTQAIISLGTGLSALGFSRIKSLFDRLSNAVFYSDAYDSQDLFDNLNKILTSSLDMDFLLKHSTALLARELKADFSLLSLRGGPDSDYRIFSSNDMRYNRERIDTIRQVIQKNHSGTVVTDELGETDTKFRDVLMANNIAVTVRLTSSTRKENSALGYLIMGTKRSGSPYNSQDVRVLTTVANELAIAIQNVMQFEEIQHFNITLQERVDRATAELRRTNQKLEALDETKDDFISMASHQLRTPLTSVKGYLSMVLEGDAGKVSGTQAKMLNQAFISSQRMVYLITDLLNVSRLKTGKFVIDATPVDLTKIIAEEVSQLVETAQARGIELTYDKPASLMPLMLDETKIRQVIMNFIDNAIYYTPSGGHIRVEIADNPTTVELKVVDDGIGVPKSEQHHLFTKFYRAGNARKARPDGTGLGLFMAKKVIVAQGGSIIFSSKENGGSTFGFTFSKEKLKAPDHFKPTVVAATKTKKPAKSPALV